MNNSEKLYIILPVHNRRELTREFIESLQKQSPVSFQLILVDDGSHDGTAEMVRANYPSTTLLQGTGDWWWGGSLQQAFLWLGQQSHAENDSVLIINDDTRVESDFLFRGLAALRANPHSLVMAECYSIETGKLLDRGVHVDWRKFRFEQAAWGAEINCLSTRGLFLSLSDFLDLGGFYPRLLPHYAADYEFTMRAHARGLRLLTDPALKIFVHEHATGFDAIKATSHIEALQRLFSLKCTVNPLVWTAFIFLACPWPHWPRNILRAWKYAAITTLKATGTNPG